MDAFILTPVRTRRAESDGPRAGDIEASARFARWRNDRLTRDVACGADRRVCQPVQRTRQGGTCQSLARRGAALRSTIDLLSLSLSLSLSLAIDDRFLVQCMEIALVNRLLAFVGDRKEQSGQVAPGDARALWLMRWLQVNDWADKLKTYLSDLDEMRRLLTTTMRTGATPISGIVDVSDLRRRVGENAAWCAAAANSLLTHFGATMEQLWPDTVRDYVVHVRATPMAHWRTVRSDVLFRDNVAERTSTLLSLCICCAACRAAARRHRDGDS